jgi:hypothetical protein
LLHAPGLADDPPEDAPETAVVKRTAISVCHLRKDLFFTLGVADIPPHRLLPPGKIQRYAGPRVEQPNQFRV